MPVWLPYAVVFAFSFLLYSNTLFNRYAIDDVIVLTDNQYTKKGLAGVKEHLTHDMFEGFFGERGARLVSGGRYRPLSMITLAIEYEIMRKVRGDKREEINEKNIILTDNDPYLNPFLSHFINVLLFALTCLMLYHLLRKVLPATLSVATPLGELGIAFFAAMLYAAHPVHTEAVANIKGRDEVMCMLFSLIALYAAVKYVRTDNVAHLLWGTGIFFLALMSKENAVTFLAVVPLTLYFFTKAKTKHYAATTGLYLAVLVVFLLLRSAYTQSGITEDSPEILNNPFVGATFAQRIATAVYTWLRYYWIMIFPHPLTHDYYFNQIPIIGPGDFKFVVSLLVTAALGLYALVNLPKKSLASYSILFFFITFSVVTNILFTVGVLMNERFIYMSSLGFSILVAYLILHYIKNKQAAGIVLGVLLTLYSVKTFSRNFDWLDSFTLFRRDVLHSPNSAKIQTSVGGDLTKAADSDIKALRDSGMVVKFIEDLRGKGMSDDEKRFFNSMPDSSIRKMFLDSSIAHLREAIRVYPTHSNAWLLLGNALYKRNNDPNEVVPVYQNANAYRVGGYYDAFFNLGVVYNDINKPDSAIANLYRALALKPENTECKFLLAQSFAKLNRSDSVQAWMQRFEQQKPIGAHEYYLLGTAYGKTAGNLNAAIECLKIAHEKAPQVELYLEDLAAAYGFSGKYDEAIATSLQLLALNPNYPAALMNISVSYRNKGNVAQALEYCEKARKLNPAYPPCQ